MAMDYSACAIPKGRPAKLEKADRVRERETADERENVKVRARSGGQCEVYERRRRLSRCKRRAFQIHHMIGGWGRRARGKSLLAKHKQHVCADCHSDITGHVLMRRGDHVDPLYTDWYERAK